jgi:lipopolysaccharide export system protein LptA
MAHPLLLAASIAAGAAGALVEPPAQPAAPPASTPPPAAAAPPAGLRPIDASKPVRVDADEVRFNWSTRQVKVVGKPLVTLTHDDATLTCRVLTGENDAQGRLKVATCEGDVRLVRATRVVTCERATYDRAASLVVCRGNPLLKDGATEIRGDKLTWDLAADEVRLEGDVRGTMPGDLLDLGKLSPADGAAAPAPGTSAEAGK